MGNELQSSQDKEATLWHIKIEILTNLNEKCL